MTPNRAIVRAFACALVAALLLPACAQEQVRVAGVAGEDIAVRDLAALPPTVLGLHAGREDVQEALGQVDRSYVDGVGVYALRDGDLLQATLQVSTFGPDERYRSDEFRRAVVAGVGASEPRELRLDDQAVYRTSGSQQQLYVWFRDNRFYVLAIRKDFSQPRTLLRTVLGLTS